MFLKIVQIVQIVQACNCNFLHALPIKTANPSMNNQASTHNEPYR